MDLLIRHTRQKDHIYAFFAFLEEGEAMEDLDADEWKLNASIAAWMIDTPESARDWQNTVATYTANAMRREGFEVGRITFDDGHEYEPPVECDDSDDGNGV